VMTGTIDNLFKKNIANIYEIWFSDRCPIGKRSIPFYRSIETIKSTIIIGVLSPIYFHKHKGLLSSMMNWECPTCSGGSCFLPTSRKGKSEPLGGGKRA